MVVVPVFAVAQVVASPRARHNTTRNPSEAKRGSSAKVFTVAAVLAVAGAGVWLMIGLSSPEEKVKPPVVPAPAVTEADGAADKASASVAAPEAESAPSPAAGESQPEPASDTATVAGLAGDKSRWPKSLKLSAPTRFPAIYKGRLVGEVTVPAGSSVELVSLSEDGVEVRFRDAKQKLPHDATNLAELAAAASSAPAEKTKPLAPPNDKPAPGRPESDPSLLGAARSIDATIRKALSKKKLSPPASVDEERFLRRAYLVAVGRIPTAEEAGRFFSDKNPHTRATLVSQLVRSPGYSSQMANWVFDRLRIVDYNSVAQIRFPVYRQWVRQAVNDNMPWDKMVTALLTTQGGGWDATTAPVGYFTRDRGMPLDNLAITMRVFLGDRMECAQCHNDPFGETKQKDFFRLAAFTNGQEPARQDLFRGIFEEMNALPQDSVEHGAAWMFWRDVYGNSLAGGGTGRIALPHDYKYKDARPGEMVGARAPFGESTTATARRDRDDGREKLAEWMILGTGDRFPAMIANGMWGKVMGRGFFEPADAYVELPETHEPEVAALLIATMKQLDYNLRDYQEVLMLTEAFQAAPNPEPSKAIGGADDFQGRRVQRLAAEQVWDSLVTLAAGNPDDQPRRPVDDRIFIGGRPVLEGRMNMTKLSREVLAIEDGEKLREYFAKFVELVKNEDSQDKDSEASMATMRADPVSFVRDTHARASELPSPAPPGHFLNLFGQSNREIVDGATREPNMGQVLSLMNGFVQRELIAKPDARLNLDLESAETPPEKIRRLHLAVFSREPTSDETGQLAAEFEAAPATAVANIASAMMMSAEFLYLQ